MKWQTKIFILIIGSSLLVLGFALPLIESWLYWFALFFLSMAGVLLIGFIILSWQISREKLLDVRTVRKQKEYITQLDGHGMLHLINVVSGHTQNLTIDTRAYRNGHYEEPRQSEQYAYTLAVAKNQKQIEAALPPLIIDNPQQQLDLLRIFTQVQQAYAIIAGQRVGKSFTGQRIANYWSQSGCIPIWIGPKLNIGEWQNCIIHGGQEDYGKVAHGLRVVEQLAKQRHGDTSKAHEAHSIQPVFLDDWTQIRKHLGEYAESFIVDATTLYASVNIVLYFMLHADTVNAWGVGKVGAALHQNFYKLFIEPGISESGEIDRSKNTGWILMPGQTKKDRRRINLFSGTGQPILIPAQVESNDDKFIRLVKNGVSRNQASIETWGRAYAGDLVRHGKQLLGE